MYGPGMNLDERDRVCLHGAAIAAKVAYDPEDVFGVARFYPFDNPSSGSMGYVHDRRSTGGDIVLAFAGTQITDWNDWRNNLNGLGRHWDVLGSRTHRGFLKAWWSVRPRVLEILGGIGAAGILRVTGHSLGGAMARLAAFELQTTRPDFGVRCTCFGAPGQFTLLGARKVQQVLDGRLWDVINQCDPVPRVAGILGWRRAGITVYIDREGALKLGSTALSRLMDARASRFRGIGDDHSLGRYIMNVFSNCP